MKIIVGQHGNIVNFANVFSIEIIQPPWSDGKNHRQLNANTTSAFEGEIGVIRSLLYEGHTKNAEEVREYLLAKLVDPKCMVIDLNECIKHLRKLEYKEKQAEARKPDNDEPEIPF